MGCTQRKCNRRVQVSQGVSDLHPLLFDAEKVHTMGRGINRRSTLATGCSQESHPLSVLCVKRLHLTAGNRCSN